MARTREMFELVGRYMRGNITEYYVVRSLSSRQEKKLGDPEMAFLVARGQIMNVTAQLYKSDVLYRGNNGLEIGKLPVVQMRPKEPVANTSEETNAGSSSNGNISTAGNTVESSGNTAVTKTSVADSKPAVPKTFSELESHGNTRAVFAEGVRTEKQEGEYRLEGHRRGGVSMANQRSGYTPMEVEKTTRGELGNYDARVQNMEKDYYDAWGHVSGPIQFQDVNDWKTYDGYRLEVYKVGYGACMKRDGDSIKGKVWYCRIRKKSNTGREVDDFVIDALDGELCKYQFPWIVKEFGKELKEYAENYKLTGDERYKLPEDVPYDEAAACQNFVDYQGLMIRLGMYSMLPVYDKAAILAMRFNKDVFDGKLDTAMKVCMTGIGEYSKIDDADDGNRQQDPWGDYGDNGRYIILDSKYIVEHTRTGKDKWGAHRTDCVNSRTGQAALLHLMCHCYVAKNRDKIQIPNDMKLPVDQSEYNTAEHDDSFFAVMYMAAEKSGFSPKEIFGYDGSKLSDDIGETKYTTAFENGREYNPEATTSLVFDGVDGATPVEKAANELKVFGHVDDDADSQGVRANLFDALLTILADRVTAYTVLDKVHAMLEDYTVDEKEQTVMFSVSWADNTSKHEIRTGSSFRFFVGDNRLFLHRFDALSGDYVTMASMQIEDADDNLGMKGAVIEAFQRIDMYIIRNKRDRSERYGGDVDSWNEHAMTDDLSFHKSEEYNEACRNGKDSHDNIWFIDFCKLIEENWHNIEGEIMDALGRSIRTVKHECNNDSGYVYIEMYKDTLDTSDEWEADTFADYIMYLDTGDRDEIDKSITDGRKIKEDVKIFVPTNDGGMFKVKRMVVSADVRNTREITADNRRKEIWIAVRRAIKDMCLDVLNKLATDSGNEFYRDYTKGQKGDFRKFIVNAKADRADDWYKRAKGLLSDDEFKDEWISIVETNLDEYKFNIIPRDKSRTIRMVITDKHGDPHLYQVAFGDSLMVVVKGSLIHGEYVCESPMPDAQSDSAEKDFERALAMTFVDIGNYFLNNVET